MTTARDELLAMRDRLNALERAIVEHYATEPDTSPVASWGAFTPDPALEAEEARRQRDPDAVGPVSMPLALYLEHKRAASAEKKENA